MSTNIDTHNVTRIETSSNRLKGTESVVTRLIMTTRDGEVVTLTLFSADFLLIEGAEYVNLQAKLAEIEAITNEVQSV